MARLAGRRSLIVKNTLTEPSLLTALALTMTQLCCEQLIGNDGVNFFGRFAWGNLAQAPYFNGDHVDRRGHGRFEAGEAHQRNLGWIARNW